MAHSEMIWLAGQLTWKKSEWAKAAKSPYVFLGNHTTMHKYVTEAKVSLKPGEKKTVAVR